MPFTKAGHVPTKLVMLYIDSGYDEAEFPNHAYAYELSKNREGRLKLEEERKAASQRFQVISERRFAEAHAELEAVPNLVVERAAHGSFLLWCPVDKLYLLSEVTHVEYWCKIESVLPTKQKLPEPRTVVELPGQQFEELVLEILGLDPGTHKWNCETDYDWNNDSDYISEPSRLVEQETLEFAEEASKLPPGDVEGVPSAEEMLGLGVIKGVIPDFTYVVKVCW